MKTFLQRNFLIVFLAFLVVVLIFLKILYGNTEENKTVKEIIPTITVEPTLIILEDSGDPTDY